MGLPSALQPLSLCAAGMIMIITLRQYSNAYLFFTVGCYTHTHTHTQSTEISKATLVSSE